MPTPVRSLPLELHQSPPSPINHPGSEALEHHHQHHPETLLTLPCFLRPAAFTMKRTSPIVNSVRGTRAYSSEMANALVQVSQNVGMGNAAIGLGGVSKKS